jgi:hypothetical protein
LILKLLKPLLFLIDSVLRFEVPYLLLQQAVEFEDRSLLADWVISVGGGNIIDLSFLLKVSN